MKAPLRRSEGGVAADGDTNVVGALNKEPSTIKSLNMFSHEVHPDHPPGYHTSRWLRKLRSYPDHLRWKGSVWPTVLPIVLLIAAYTYVIAALYLDYGYKNIALSNSVVPALSVVLGLLLAFRANTSYARYYEGRQLWQDLASNVRNLSRLIWCSIPERTQNDHLEKMRCMKLLLAFAVSTKHHLRKEYGCDYFDLDYLLPPNWVPAAADDMEQYGTQGNTAVNSPGSEHQQGPLEPATGDDPNDLANKKDRYASVRRRFVCDEDLPDEGNADMSLPLEILFRMSLYTQQAKDAGKIDGMFSGVIISHLNSLNDCLAGLERIVSTPIPAVYHIHLKQSLALYLLAIPFTLVAELKWWVVPIIVLASFTLHGIDAIGAQIENPFGYNDNDLPLNQFCDSLRKEIEFIVYFLPCETENALMTGN
ncbi:hypothetical protein DFQ28_009500 [Apophysomyces sp. BC1034]|nr:hypothetical protein DFQ30_009189 [Apophysomyces sp. BC1015]KAG0172856.1 hypothetical protein DFQ29_008211 [Apophysomyces sp. BC1021]KAG0185344.1 hypothetical protein DFQ28_009500 [Apophysomyces sp. BC1034]